MINIKKLYKSLLSKPYIIFITVALIGGLFFCIITPPLWGLDEPSHFARAYQLSQGNILPDTSVNNNGGLMSDNFLELEHYRNTDILDTWDYGSIINSKDVTNQYHYQELDNIKFSTSKHNYPLTASYSPIPYIGASLGIFISSIFCLSILKTIFMARFLSLLIYIAIAAFAIWLVRNKKLCWLFFVLALIPTAIFQASTVSADTMLIGLSLLFMSIFYRIISDIHVDKRFVIGLAVISILLPLIKINYILLSVGFLIVPYKIFSSKKSSYIWKSLVAFSTVTFTALWFKLTTATAHSTVSQRADGLLVSPKSQIINTINDPINTIVTFVRTLIANGDAYCQQIFFTISGNSITIPLILTIFITIVLFFCAFYAKDELQKIRKYAIKFIIIDILCVLSIFVALYIFFSPVGYGYIDGIQGRYFTPLIASIIICVASLIPIKVDSNKRTIAILAIITVLLCLIISLIYNLVSLY